MGRMRCVRFHNLSGDVSVVWRVWLPYHGPELHDCMRVFTHSHGTERYTV